MELIKGWIINHLEYLLASLFMLVGVALVGEFGVPWDEYYLRENAVRNLNWIQSFFTGEYSKGQIFQGNVDEHGPIIQLFILWIEKLLNPKDLAGVIWLRHFVGYAICVLGIFYLIKLMKLVEFKTWQILIGIAAISLHPRIFGHSFFNSKDTVLMYLFVVNSYYLLRYLERRNWIDLAIFSILSALITDIRMIGAVFPLYLVGHVAVSRLRSSEFKVSYLQLLLFGTLFLFSTYLFWPFLWDNPFIIIDKIKALSVAKQPNLTFFEGTYYVANELPWYYLPKFIFITTPIHSLVLLGLLILSPYMLFSKKPDGILNLLGVSWTITLLAFFSVIVFSPVLYNGWRHFQFVWPFLILPGVYTMGELFKMIRTSSNVKHGIVTVISAYSIYLLYSFFPYSHCYFNSTVERPSINYEVDYWGLSFKEAFNWLEAKQTGKKANVWVSDKPGKLNYELSNEAYKDGNRLTPDIQQADFIVTNYCHFETIDGQVWNQLRVGNTFPYNLPETYKIERSGVDILSIYRNSN